MLQDLQSKKVKVYLGVVQGWTDCIKGEVVAISDSLDKSSNRKNSRTYKSRHCKKSYSIVFVKSFLFSRFDLKKKSYNKKIHGGGFVSHDA